MPGMTEDVCEVDFPPVRYGESLDEVAGTIARVVERVFREPTGILRSGVYGKTMKPLTAEDVPDRVNGIGAYSENSAIPREVKPLWLNRENAIQASGKYLMALVEQYRVTQSPEVLDRARRTVHALGQLWENAATTNRFGRGWMPKPYLGIDKVSECYESSADQYTDATLGLYAYYLTMADANEKQRIVDMIVSFAHWWDDRDYAGGYFGTSIWWKRLGYPHVAGGFLFITALAHSFDPCAKLARAFDTWLELKHGFYADKAHQDVNGAGLALDCLIHLIDLKPAYADYWRRTARFAADRIVDCVEAGSLMPFLKAKTQPANYAAHYLSSAHMLMPEAGYDRWTRRCLHTCKARAHFYHVVRGQRLEDLDDKLAGNDYRNTFWCEGHVAWLSGYWRLKAAGAVEGPT